MSRAGKAFAAVVAVALAVAMETPSAWARPGSLDPSFGHHGLLVTKFAHPVLATDVAVGSNGRIVVVGSTQGDFAVAAYHPDGSLDRSFGAGGRLTTDFGRKDGAFAVAIAFGKVVVAGATGVSDFSGSFRGDFAVARYLSDGRLDPSFGHGGKATVDFGTPGDIAYGVVVQTNGKVVLAGTDRHDMLLARLTRSGVLDATFGDAGRVRTPFVGASARAYALAIQPDGKTVALGEREGPQCGEGYCDVSMAVARYRANGDLDHTFSLDGRTFVYVGVNSAGSDVHDVAIQPGGRIVGVAGQSMAGFKADGRLDRSFGNQGIVDLGVGSKRNPEFVGIAVTPGGRIVVAGAERTSCCSGFAVRRFRAGGAPDSSFGDGGGVVTVFPTGRSAWGRGVALDASGRIVVAGTVQGPAFGLARYLGS